MEGIHHGEGGQVDKDAYIGDSTGERYTQSYTIIHMVTWSKMKLFLLSVNDIEKISQGHEKNIQCQPNLYLKKVSIFKGRHMLG